MPLTVQGFLKGKGFMKDNGKNLFQTEWVKPIFSLVPISKVNS